MNNINSADHFCPLHRFKTKQVICTVVIIVGALRSHLIFLPNL